MHLIKGLVRHLILVSIAFLTSCASISSPTSIAQVPPVSRDVQQPLPPPPPYESYPGEAANVQKVLDSIKNNQHGDAPRSMPSASPSAYPHLPGYPANLTITNETKCKLGFYLLRTHITRIRNRCGPVYIARCCGWQLSVWR